MIIIEPANNLTAPAGGLNLAEKGEIMTKQQEELLLDWASVAVKELDELEDDRTARILRDGGKVLLEEINQS